MSEVQPNSVNTIVSGGDIVNNSKNFQSVAQKPPQNGTCFLHGKKNMNRNQCQSAHVSGNQKLLFCY
jgi:hypothetical protein